MQSDFVCQGRTVSATDLGWLRRIDGITRTGVGSDWREHSVSVGRIRELLVIGLVEAAGGFCGVGIAR